MSANTRQENGQPLKETLSRYAVLSAQAVTLINAERRTPDQIYVLLQSLQLFKEGRLADVFASKTVTDSGQTPDPARLQELFSLRVADMAFSPRVKRYLQQRGVDYVGEILLIKWDRTVPVKQEIETHLITLGLSPSAYGQVANWHAPYDNPETWALWDLPSDDVVDCKLGGPSWWLPKWMLDKYPLFGDLLVERDNVTGRHNEGNQRRYLDLQSKIKPEYRDRLHAGMIPARWPHRLESQKPS